MDDVWLGYSQHDTDTVILAAASLKLQVDISKLELKRNPGAVLVRIKEEEGDDEPETTPKPVSNLHFREGELWTQ